MPILVVSCLTHRTVVDGDWTDAQHSVNQFVDAIKGRPVTGYGYILVNGAPPRRRLQASNAHQAREWFAEMAASVLARACLPPPVVLVPIPNSGCTIDIESSRTAALAKELMRYSPLVGEVLDVLRWDHTMPSASTGSGPRDAALLNRHLRLRRPLTSPDSPHVLIDDVVTTGGHIRACAAFLGSHGVTPRLAVTAVKSDPDPRQDPFQTRIERLDDFAPL